MFLFLIFNSQQVFAQLQFNNLSNKRIKKIAVEFPQQQIDTVSIVPQSFVLIGIPTTAYVLDEINATIIWKEKIALDSITINYRVFSTKLNKPTQHLDYEQVRYNFEAEKPFIVNINKGNANPFLNFGTLKADGSFGRAISFGNSQDAVVNSTFNLQLSGYISDSIEIVAAITDNNIPIQPDGNTQNLRDFDRIYLQAKKKNWQVNLGDIDIRQNKQYFLNFYKRVQGISASVQSNFGKNVTNKIDVSGTVAKGKFTRNIITPIEGNQGPYRLRGANNEIYFVVLANTERVFIDGVKLTRGDDEDYIINYNTAEITFTPKHLITKDLRMQIEFEYSDRNYLNAQLFLQNEVTIGKKASIVFGAFSNSDAKNSSIDQVLDTDQKQFLANIGDSISNAFYNIAIKDSIGQGKILYRKLDSIIVSNTYPNVYVVSNNPNIDLYSLSFSNIGFGKGNYILLQNASNGRTYKWVEPIGGIPQGDWEPVTLLVTPKKLQMFSLGSNYNINEKLSVKMEVALSNYDVNLFSSRDKSDNIGLASKITIANNAAKLNLFKKPLLLNTALSNENVQERFKPLERLRNVEFYRDWGLPFTTPNATENITAVQAKLYSDEQNSFQYDATNYNRSDGYNGTRHTISNNLYVKDYTVNSSFSITNFSEALQKGIFMRPQFLLSKNFAKLKSIQSGYKYLGEYNSITQKLPDTLNLNSFGFQVHEIFLRNNQNKENRWSIMFNKRNDLLPRFKSLVNANQSNNIVVTSALTSNPNHKFIFTGTYRNLKIIDSLLSNQKADKSILGRAEYFVNEFKGFLNGSILYELGSGQEQKREFTYVEVPVGQGLYNWIDYNNNSIPELNEFEEAVFADQKKYIRLFTPSNQYVKANYLQFNYNLDLDPKLILKSKSKNAFTKILLRSTTSSALQINSKQLSQRNFLFNPFNKKTNDTTLITLNTFFSNTYFYNRTSSVFGFEFTHSKSSNKAILSYGFESRNQTSAVLKLRKSIKQSFVSNLALKQLKNELTTQASKFENRNYNVFNQIIEPSITYNYKSNLRATIGYTYGKKQNKIDSMESVKSNALFVDAKYNILSSSSITAKFTYNNLEFVGSAASKNSTVGYLLLDALQPGKNLLWNVDFTKRLGGNIEFSVQYDGRKAALGPTIHLGRASLRAIF